MNVELIIEYMYEGELANEVVDINGLLEYALVKNQKCNFTFEQLVAIDSIVNIVYLVASDGEEYSVYHNEDTDFSFKDNDIYGKMRLYLNLHHE
jgi:hypothetical protein